jgi:hypothetical protein
MRFRSNRLLLMSVLALLLSLDGCRGARTEANAALRDLDSRSEPMEPKAALARAGKVELGAGPTTVTLEGREVASRIDALGSRRLSLILRGLHASNPPGVLYHLYLNLPEGASPAGDDPRHVGIINFYGAQTGGVAPADPERIFYSFDATDAVRALRAQSGLRDPVTVTFYPVGSPEPGAKAVISRIELVEQ